MMKNGLIISRTFNVNIKINDGEKFKFTKHGPIPKELNKIYKEYDKDFNCRAPFNCKCNPRCGGNVTFICGGSNSEVTTIISTSDCNGVYKNLHGHNYKNHTLEITY